jgi:phosphoglucosamine mutase
VKNVDKAGVNHEAVRDAVMTLELSLGGSGRILLRPSGTEPVIRVMVEAPTQESAQDIAQRLAAIVTEYCSL